MKTYTFIQYHQLGIRSAQVFLDTLAQLYIMQPNKFWLSFAASAVEQSHLLSPDQYIKIVPSFYHSVGLRCPDFTRDALSAQDNELLSMFVMGFCSELDETLNAWDGYLLDSGLVSEEEICAINHELHCGDDTSHQEES